MGIFSFLRKKEETIKFSEINGWIIRYIDEKGFNSKIDEFNKETEAKIKEVKKLLFELEKATLVNENIPERLKHIMEGNRKNYVRKVNFFLNEITLPENYYEIKNFSKEFTKKLDELSAETQKSYVVLREFVEKELSNVIKKIKEIENLSIRLKKEFEENKIDEIEKIKGQLRLYDGSKGTLSELKQIKQKHQRELEEIESKEEKIKSKILSIKTDKSFKECESLKKEQEKIILEINDQRKKIITSFLPIDRALKKYKRLSLEEKIIDKYLEDPVNAIISDADLKIVSILEKMSKSIKELNLKDKQQDKMKQDIIKLNNHILSKLRDDLQDILERQKNTKSKLLANTSAMNLSEQESWLENTQKNVKEKLVEINNIEQKMERANSENIKKNLKELLKEFSVDMQNG
ncbi:MAG: hypothetical protein KJ583_00965 [Nanoarchaeota archaeon]|nr:hypothetical protein [Nanoarchaeota archaeon]MBU1269221.1 hypothetical protein [Nanoarchaeota archaeon]MBU1603861.1 hypothetical protein [Nanoarchaeota archaeon]